MAATDNSESSATARANGTSLSGGSASEAAVPAVKKTAKKVAAKKTARKVARKAAPRKAEPVSTTVGPVGGIEAESSTASSIEPDSVELKDSAPVKKAAKKTAKKGSQESSQKGS
ncbi:hypothetical protein BFF99_07245 [Corynebacterium pseudotuberculosis]|nr:hypothetical protein BFF99_07245 [Corynebacterium pseudotuberculosis]